MVDKWVSARRDATHREDRSARTPSQDALVDRLNDSTRPEDRMRLFGKRETKSAVPLTAIADLRRRREVSASAR